MTRGRATFRQTTSKLHECQKEESGAALIRIRLSANRKQSLGQMNLPSHCYQPPAEVKHGEDSVVVGAAISSFSADPVMTMHDNVTTKDCCMDFGGPDFSYRAEIVLWGWRYL